MNIQGNQYADKVFSEHPTALWPLDEQVFYLSLIDDNDRLFSNWTLTNATSNDNPTMPNPQAPFLSEISSSITSNTSSETTIEAESQELFGLADINSQDLTFCVNFFLYQKPDFINWIKVGYRYTDAFSNLQEVISEEILPPSQESWINLNNTYQIPGSWSGNLKTFIQVSLSNSSGGDDTSRTIILNGLSVGQDSETTCYESLGSQKVPLPTSLGFADVYGISADQYGLLSDNGYHIVRNNNLLAKNNGFPLVYGTHQSTKIYPSNVNLPSFVFPGKGMLNEAGRNKDYTLEMWIKLDASTSVAQKIIGPVSTNSGLYVKEGFLTLVVGNEISSYCVSEWYRPMLLHLIIKENNVLVLINGELVISVPYQRSIIDLPNDRDWWGIYSYSTISMFQLDCISIYLYPVPESVAKKRFVYGQGTPAIQSIDGGFYGTPTTIDFATSEYNASVIYPDIYRWDAGYFNNMDATRTSLSTPSYSLPNINIGERDLFEWYADNYIVNTLEYPERNHPNFFTFRPNVSYDIDGIPVSWSYSGNNYNEKYYLNFPSLNILNNALASFYGIFEVEEDIDENRTLMSFVNITNSDRFDIYINSDTVYYSINNRIIHQEVISIGIEFLVGVNIELSGSQFGYEVSKLFSSPSSVQMYIGGDGFNTFEGKIYSIGFSNQSNFEKISDNFSSNGIAISENYEILSEHISSYTLVPEYEYGLLFLDISVDSEWEEYYPLSYFASYVKNENESYTYDLDMLQVNVGYSYVQSEGTWTYDQLKDEYLTQTYLDLSESVYSNYFNLYKNNTSGDTVNLSKSSLQSYITFQPIANGANAPLSSFLYTKNLPLDSVIYADEENTALLPEKTYKTRFSFKDNTIIYPPKTNNFEDYAMVVYMGIKQRSILKNPLKINSLEISSKNLNYNSSLESSNQRSFIGTKFGTKVYPQKIIEGQKDYKSKNPLTIYKTGSPYLYTTKKSGIEIINKTISEVSPLQEFMTSIPINSNASYDFEVGAIQFFFKGSFTEDFENIKIMDINHKAGKACLVLEKSLLGNIVKAYTNDGFAFTQDTNVSFYQNGRYVLSPKIINNEWNAIGISFAEPLDFEQYSNGSLDLFGGAVFNNISYYLSKGLGIKTDISTNTWGNVLNYEGTARSWSFWNNDNKVWRDVYISGQTTSYIQSPEDIYKSYTGTNKNIIDDGLGIQINKTDSSIYTDVLWQTITTKPL